MWTFWTFYLGFCSCGTDDNEPTNSSRLRKVPDVTPLKARAGNWKINLVVLTDEGNIFYLSVIGLRWHLSASATLLPVLRIDSEVLVSWVNDPHILFVSYCVAPAELPPFARLRITCRAVTCLLLWHLTHQHTQRATTKMIRIAKPEEKEIMVSIAETHANTRMSKPQVSSPNLITDLRFSWVNKSLCSLNVDGKYNMGSSHHTVCPRSWPPLECWLWLCGDRRTPGRCTGPHPSLWARAGRPSQPLPFRQTSHRSWNTRQKVFFIFFYCEQIPGKHQNKQCFRFKTSACATRGPSVPTRDRNLQTSATYIKFHLFKRAQSFPKIAGHWSF